MHQSASNPWLFVAAACGAVYPILIYYASGYLPFHYFAVVGGLLIGLRLLGLRRDSSLRWAQAVFVAAILVLFTALFFNARLAALGYPVLVSLSVAGVFALSLRYPPTVVERIARLSEPDLSFEGVAYTRHVTEVWVVFLLLNASISAATALWGSLAQWTLWNGLLSYLCMGTLFVGEWLVRRWRRV